MFHAASQGCAALTVQSTAFIRSTVNDTDESCLFRPVQALCLGLGPLNYPDHDRSASQLVAFQAFLEAWSIPPERVKMHDPRFTDEDKHHLSSLGYQLAKSPEDAQEDLVCGAPTFVFAPYLPYPVIELLFERNWSPGRLSNLVIIGTPLEGWLDDEYMQWESFGCVCNSDSGILLIP